MNAFTLILILLYLSVFINCYNETNNDATNNNNNTIDLTITADDGDGDVDGDVDGGTDDDNDNKGIDNKGNDNKINDKEKQDEEEAFNTLQHSISTSSNSKEAYLDGYGLYKRYKHYPNYCSTPHEMLGRTIPPLKTTDNNNNNNKKQKTKLIQVISIIRHGARTPYSNGMHCWDNYRSNNIDTSKWDCNLDTILAPPTSPSIKKESSNKQQKKMILFEKKYDALKTPLNNELNGTCQLGQLLLQGYIQEVTNGQILKKAYLDTTDEHMHMHLFHNTSVLSNETHLHTYYRADDMQRTLMSGQVLLQSLFGSNFMNDIINIPIHTTDKLVDILEPNTFTCPKLNVIKQEAYQSREFKLKNTSKEAMDVRSILYDTLKTKSPSSSTSNSGNSIEKEGLDVMVDCLMTTICSDKTLPDYVNDFDGNETSIDSKFKRIIDLSTWKWLYVYQYKKAAYSKLAMGPLWADIYERMVIATSNKPTSTSKERLVLYSAHDVTIMNLLASLDLDVTNMPIAPYASLLNIEIHAMIDDDDDENEDIILDDDDTTTTTTTTKDTIDKESIKHGFRLIYNGKVLTSLLSYCPNDKELCDVNILYEHISKFATRNRQKECTIINPTSISTLTKQSVKSFNQSPIVSIIIALISCIIGSYITFYMLTKNVVMRNTNTIINNSDDLVLEEEDGGNYGTSRGAGKEVFKQVFDAESELI